MKLVVISHTEHYKKTDSTIVGWGSTVNELNNIIGEFDEIVHIAMLHSGIPPKSSLPYISSKIKFVELPVLGGITIFSKIKILIYAPKVIKIVLKEIKTSDLFQLRTPTGIGIFLIPFLTWFVNTKGWYKYAGNWNQENPPISYRIQRWMLKNQKRPVTINGKWKNQPQHCFSFENPCLSEEERIIGANTCKQKIIVDKINYCFVGSLNKNKGIDKIIDAFKNISNDKIETFHVVGEGHLRHTLEQKTIRLSINTKFYGALTINEVQEVYKKSHFIILPSISEGFPKVIGEAMNYGCVPIVSDISCIRQYVRNHINGFLIDPINILEVKKAINSSLEITNKEFKAYITKNYILANKFTYAYYKERIQKKIF